MGTDDYNKGLWGLPGDTWNPDYQRGQRDGGHDGGGGGGGAGIFLLVLIPIILIVAAIILAIGGIIAALALVVLNLIPGHSSVSLGAAAKLGAMTALGWLIGTGICVGLVLFLPSVSDGGLGWLEHALYKELTGLLSTIPYITNEVFGETFRDVYADAMMADGRVSTDMLHLLGVAIAKALVWGVPLVFFVNVYLADFSVSYIPGKGMLAFAFAIGAGALAVTLPLANWLAVTLASHFMPVPDRMYDVSPLVLSLLLEPEPALYSLIAFSAGGLLAGPAFLTLSRLSAGKSVAGIGSYAGAAIGWAFLFVIAGLVLLGVMYCWPPGDGMILWAFEARFPEGFAIEDVDPAELAIPAPGLLEALPGFLIAGIPSILLLAAVLQWSDMFSSYKNYQFAIGISVAAWAFAIVGTIAMLAGAHGGVTALMFYMENFYTP